MGAFGSLFVYVSFYRDYRFAPLSQGENDRFVLNEIGNFDQPLVPKSVSVESIVKHNYHFQPDHQSFCTGGRAHDLHLYTS